MVNFNVNLLKKINFIPNLFLEKEPTYKSCLLILDVKLFRSQVKIKHSKDREFL